MSVAAVHTRFTCDATDADAARFVGVEGRVTSDNELGGVIGFGVGTVGETGKIGGCGITAGVVGDCAFTMLNEFSSARVFGPTRPTDSKPFASWSNFTAAYVRGPKYPVASALRYPFSFNSI